MKEALAIIGKFGTGAGIGALLGVALVIWVEPTNQGGVGVLIAIPALVGMIISSMISKKTSKPDKSEKKDDPKEAGSKVVDEGDHGLSPSDD